MTSTFLFLDDPSQFRDADSLLVRVPCGIRSKEKLFGIYQDSLRLPKYFGRNWDAFEECLCDLSWLSPNQPLTIVHEDLPFGAGGENRAIYFDILRDVLNHWLQSGGRRMQVIVPASSGSDLTPRASEPR